jgi:hypothetical protein
LCDPSHTLTQRNNKTWIITCDSLWFGAKSPLRYENETTNSVIWWDTLANTHHLVPLDYTSRKFDKNDMLTFVYTSPSIEEFASKFRTLTEQIDMFVAELTINPQP